MLQVITNSFVTVSTLPEAEAAAMMLDSLTTSALFPADLTASVNVLNILFSDQQSRQANGTNATSDLFRQVRFHGRINCWYVYKPLVLAQGSNEFLPLSAVYWFWLGVYEHVQVVPDHTLAGLQ